MPPAQKASLISGKSLALLHTLSFKSQPYLGDLFAAVTDDKRPLVIVAGAGVSMNAGLPSWTQLIGKLEDMVADTTVRDRLKRHSSDSLRKAELTLQLLQRQNPNAETHEFIRDALYPRDAVTRPGELALAVGRLVAARRGTTYVVTTNFDMLLEESLTPLIRPRRVLPFSLDDTEKAWRDYCDAGNIGVLHLHGAIRPRNKPKRPVVLADSHFLKYGGSVRKRLAELLTGTNALFIGLSLTDPNVVGPLYDLSSKKNAAAKGGRYALTSVDLPDGDAQDREQAASFAVESVRFLDDVLGLRPVLLKSYGQVVQVLSDLALACGDAGYLGGSAAALHYGPRLRAALQNVYRSIGAEGPEFELPPAATRALTDNLRRALEGQGGILELLRELSAEYRAAQELGSGDEQFGLHLWLRAVSVTDTSAEPAYALRLVGSSTFEARDPWFLRRPCMVGRDSPYASAQAVYLARPLKANLAAPRNSSVWRGVLALPVVLAGSASRAQVGRELLDRLTVGAITLDSTRAVVREPDVDRPGVLAELSQEDRDRFDERIQTAVLNALAWGPTST